MAAPNRAKILAKLVTHVTRQFPVALPKELNVLDHLLLAMVQEGLPPSRALPLYEKLRGAFHDLNELRVSHRREVTLVLSECSQAEVKAKRISDVLRFIFETTYQFDLESMKKKPLKQAQKQLSKMLGMTPFVVAAVVQRSLGGPLVPIDTAMVQTLVEFEAVEPDSTAQSLMAELEPALPKTKAVAFALGLAELAYQPADVKAALRDTINAKKGRAGKDDEDEVETDDESVTDDTTDINADEPQREPDPTTATDSGKRPSRRAAAANQEESAKSTGKTKKSSTGPKRRSQNG